MLTNNAASSGPAIVVEGVTKTFAPIGGGARCRALDHVSLTVAASEVVVIIGPSGSGKSTLLRTINALEKVDEGRIVVAGIEATSPKANLQTLRMGVGMVFQHFNLFLHKTALENVMLPQIIVRKKSRAEAMEISKAFLDKVGVLDRGDHYPGQLSGGQQQRVAIARALAMQPQVMLFDEATSALDPEMVGGILDLMAEMAADGMTMVAVTHEMRFARSAADRVVFMDGGTIIEQGAPEDIFDRATNERTRKFLSQIH
ncbi:MAG: amino acid ABC transporter ATP-binding protein [Proteobacteria bacterium]|nr:amino acid ABC transporter ATP-binding protein [Pseudomonadota bacterium]